MNHDKKAVTIYVNGTKQEVEKGKITYAGVVVLAFPDYEQHPEITYSVKYTKGESNQEGILSKTGSVNVREGMEFSVSDTGQS